MDEKLFVYPLAVIGGCVVGFLTIFVIRGTLFNAECSITFNTRSFPRPAKPADAVTPAIEQTPDQTEERQ